jgi:two-component system, cell cycle sensor histidine kinase and response regulator CckA
MNYDIMTKNELISEIDILNQKISHLQNNESIDCERNVHLEKCQKIINNINDWVWETDVNGKITFSNSKIFQLLGYNPDEIIDRYIFDLMPPDNSEATKKIFFDSIKKKVPFQLLENILLHKNGTGIWIETSAAPVFNDGNEISGFCGCDREITARKSLESQLEESDAELNAIFRALPDLLFILDSENRIKSFHFGENQSFILSTDKFLNKNISEFFPDEILKEITEKINLTKTTNKVNSYEYCLEINGVLQYFEARFSLINKQQMVAIIRNITNRMQAIHDMEEEKEKLAVTLRSIGDGVIATDLNGNVTLMNRIAELLTGWSSHEAIGKPFIDVFRIIDEKTRDPKDDLINAVLKLGGFMIIEKDMVLIMKDGTEKLITDSIAPIRDKQSKIVGVVLVFREFSERQQTEKKLTHLEKIESIGLLAGGIAHDFNNIMTSILGNISLAKFYAKNDDKVCKRLNEAEIASVRAKDLTQQLLTFSKGGEPIKEIIQIENLIRESATFVLSGSKSSISFDIDDNLLTVEVDPGQISQVINNIVINGDQAMPDGGCIHIKARNYAHPKDLSDSIKPGDYVVIEISDTGVGIHSDLLSRIFDPYFSTKPRGSGLGLSITYSILKRHNGYIDVKSEIGKGTTFRIYLPASGALIPKQQIEPKEIQTGTAKILVMDDEELVRSICAEILLNLGYDVETASHGEEAISMFNNALDSEKRFDLVIMDLTIPGGLGGKETLMRLKKLDPTIKSIVASGYSNDPVMANYKEHGFDEVLTKPYKFEDLSSIVGHVISK